MKRKIYHTKNRMFYQEPGFLKRMEWNFSQHITHFGCPPKQIYLKSKQFKEFGEIVGDWRSRYDQYYYKGATVIKL